MPFLLSSFLVLYCSGVIICSEPHATYLKLVWTGECVLVYTRLCVWELTKLQKEESPQFSQLNSCLEGVIRLVKRVRDAEGMGATISEATERNKLNYDQVFFGLKTQFTEKSGLFWWFCFSCFDSHSDGTHSLQRILCWASDVMLLFSKYETNSSTSWIFIFWMDNICI